MIHILSLQREKAATGTLATCTQIVWTYIFELAFLHEALNRWSLIGTGLILGDMFVVVVAAVKMRGTHRKNKLLRPEPLMDVEPSECTALKANGNVRYDVESLQK